MKPYSIKRLNESFGSHKSPKIESHIINTNPNMILKRNIPNLSTQSSENFLFSDRFQIKNLKEKNNLKQSAHTSSKISMISKSNMVNNINNHHLDLIQKNKYYNDHISKKNNNIHPNVNKILNEKVNEINKTPKQILHLNKRIKREKFSKKNYINIPKLINNKKADIKLSSIHSNDNDISHENKHKKNLSFNYSQGNLYKGLSFKENFKYDDINNNYVSNYSKIINKKDKKGYLYNKYYTDADLSSYNTSNIKENKNLFGNDIFDNSKIMKKEIYLNNQSKNEYIINTYIYNSPIEQHNIINNKNYITSKINNSPINQVKNNNNENKKILSSSPNRKNIDKNRINNNYKNNIPYDKVKLIPTNRTQNKKIILKNELNNDILKRNETNNNNFRIKKNIFYNLYPNIYKDELSFQNIKKNVRTTKATLEENDLDNKSVKFSFSSNKFKFTPKNISKENKNKKDIATYLGELSSDKNNKNLYNYYNIQENHKNNIPKQIKNEYIEDIKSICIIDPRGNKNNNSIKISNMNKTSKIGDKVNNNCQMIISKTSSNRKNINNTPRNAMNLNKIEMLNLKNNSMKKNDVYLGNISNTIEHNNENKTNRIITSELGIHINNHNEKKINENNKEHLLKNNKSIINISSNAPNTLFKSIRTGKNLNNLSPSKLNQSRKENEFNYELLNNIPSFKRNNLYSQIKKSKDINKSDISKYDKSNNISNLKMKKINTNNLNPKEIGTQNIPNKISLDANKSKEKKVIIKKQKQIINNFSENNIYEKSKNNKQYLNKKQTKKEINFIKVNLDELKLNNNKNISKNKNEINTLETNKNQIIIDNNINSEKKINSQNKKIPNKKALNKIYIKPSCTSPNNYKQYKTEHKYIKPMNNSSRNKNYINKLNYMKTSSSQNSLIFKEFYKTSSPKLKTHKSDNYLKTNIKKDNSLLQNVIELDTIDEIKIRENIIRKYCFIFKYNDYFLKMPKVDVCYIRKIFPKNNSRINSDYFSKIREDLDNNDNDFNKTFSIKNIILSENKQSIEKVNSFAKKENSIDNNIDNKINTK